MKYRAGDNALCKKLYVSWPFIISSRGEERGGGEGGRNAQQLHSRAQSRDIKVWSSDEASAQHFIATYAIKRSKSFLNATYFLFWNIIFLLTVQCQSFATFVSISRSSPTTIINNSIRFKFHASIILSLIIRKEGGIEKEPEPIRLFNVWK